MQFLFRFSEVSCLVLVFFFPFCGLYVLLKETLSLAAIHHHIFAVFTTVHI